MPAPHPLDRPAWSALNGPHSAFAVTAGLARRYHPDFGVFAGIGAPSARAMCDVAALVQAYGDVAFLEGDAPPIAGGLQIVSQDAGVQMVASRIDGRASLSVPILRLEEADAPEMRELAALTAPGPFFVRTHQLGDFVGIRIKGRLVAMAGERMKPPGFTEISGVCTHPDFRGRGYAAALMHDVAEAILARGETPFLHAYASNAAAIALYERLGFTLRRKIWMTRLGPVAP